MKLQKIGNAIIDLESIECIYVRESDQGDDCLGEYLVEVDFKTNHSIHVFMGTEDECKNVVQNILVGNDWPYMRLRGAVIRTLSAQQGWIKRDAPELVQSLAELEKIITETYV